MNSPLTKHSYKNIRTIAQTDGEMHALKYIRVFHAKDYLVAKMVLKDVLAYESWTMPWIKPDINAVRERVWLNAP